MKTIAVSVDDLYSQMPQWCPLSEMTLRSYLIKNPQCVSPDARFIGCELFRIDLIFEDNTFIYLVETKGEGSNIQITKAVSQLDEARERIHYLNFSKKIELVIAYIGIELPQKVHLKPLEKRLEDEITYLKKQKTSLENEIHELEIKKTQVKQWVLQKAKKSQKLIKVKPSCSKCINFGFNWCNELDEPIKATSSCTQYFMPKEAFIDKQMKNEIEN